MSDELITATVYGSSVYNVEIRLKGGNIESMDCDCPYSMEGNNCKHMAAVLYAVEENEEETSFAQTETPHEAARSIEEIIGSLSEDELRASLLKAALKYQDVMDSLIMSEKKPWTNRRRKGG